MLRWGPNEAPTIVIALPLFEEANRTRATIVATLELLARQGVSGALPDLPGTGDSEVDTINARLGDWRTSFAAAATSLRTPVHVAAIRGGALLVAEAQAASTWLLSPQDGADAVRELRRARSLGDDGLFAGNDIHPALLSELENEQGTPVRGPLRVARLAGDPRPADVIIDAAPPWRAAEPVRDEALSRALAGDLSCWIATCGG